MAEQEMLTVEQVDREAAAYIAIAFGEFRWSVPKLTVDQ